MNLWHLYEAKIAIRNRIVGGIPMAPKLIEGWLAASMPDVAAEERKKLAEATAAELPEITEEAAGAMWTTFKRNDDGLYIEGRQIKAAIKEASNVLRALLTADEGAGKKKKDGAAAGTKEKSRYTNLRSRVAERVFVVEDVVALCDGNGARIREPSGTEERAIHVMTAAGPRNALKRVDYVVAPHLSFTLRVLRDGVVDEPLLRVLFDYMGENGLGADRSQGNGTFQLVSLKLVADRQ